MPKTLPLTPKAAQGTGTSSSRLRSAARMGDASMFDSSVFDAVVSSSGPGDGAGRVKRNPLMVGGGVLFAAVAMFTGALLLNARGERRAVVVSAREIPAGTVIQADMLRIEHIEADTQLRAIPGPRYGLLVGKVARERIPAGVLVVEEQVGAVLQPPLGFALVAMTLEPGELPVASLAYGDTVQVVRTPQASSADDPGGIISTASVWSMWQQSSQASATGGSKRALTLAVAQADAVAVTQAAARREIRLIAVGGDPVFSPQIGELGAQFPAPENAAPVVETPSTTPATTPTTTPATTLAMQQPGAPVVAAPAGQ